MYLLGLTFSTKKQVCIVLCSATLLQCRCDLPCVEEDTSSSIDHLRLALASLHCAQIWARFSQEWGWWMGGWQSWRGNRDLRKTEDGSATCLALACLGSCIVLRFVPDSWRRTEGAGEDRKRKGKHKRGRHYIGILVTIKFGGCQ